MNKRFIANTSWIIGSQIIKNLLGLVISIFTAKYLGPSNYGIIGYITSVCTFLTAVANLGLANIIIKEIIANKGKEGEVVGTAITMQLISSFICYLIVIGIVIVLNLNDKTMWICAILQAWTLVFSAFDNIKYYYQSRLESKYSEIITLIAYFVMQVYKIYLLATNKSVEWFAFATSLDYIIIAVFLVGSYVKTKGPRWGFSKDIAKKLLKQSGPFILSGSVSVIYSSMDRVMLKELLGNTTGVGYYNVAYTISHVWVFVISALITSFAPLIYQKAQHENAKEKEAYIVRVRQLYFLVFWLGAAASIVVDLLSPWLINILYDNVYQESISPTMILTWASVFAYLGVARGIQFVCEKKQKYIVLLATLTVVVNLTFNFILIPILGVSGAALATLISEFFVCLIAPLIFKKTHNIGIDIWCAIFFRGINFRSAINIIQSKLKKVINKSKNNNEANTDISKQEEYQTNDSISDNCDKREAIEESAKETKKTD